MAEQQPGRVSVVRPEDMLEDSQDVRVIGGVEVRKGTLGAFMINARQLARYGQDSAEYAQLAGELRRLAPAVRALGVLDVFSPRTPELAEILESGEGEQ